MVQRDQARAGEFARTNNKALDRTVEQICRQRCNGMQLDVMRIPELFRISRAALIAGESHIQVGDRIVAFATNRVAE